jgi:hypothetical protein
MTAKIAGPTFTFVKRLLGDLHIQPYMKCPGPTLVRMDGSAFSGGTSAPLNPYA